jgi:WXG100 family type VII secretion target
MAGDDTILYDYDVIDQCLVMMAKKAEEIQNQTDELEADVKRIMVGWEGDTAIAYERLCGDMRNDLIQNRENLDSLNKAFDQAKIEMQNQDRSGGGVVGG